MDVTTWGRSLVAFVESMMRMARWSTWETIGLENTRRALPSHLGQGTDLGAVPIGKLTSHGPSSSQEYW